MIPCPQQGDTTMTLRTMTLQIVGRIPEYLVQDISDRGASETWGESDRIPEDKDDLRLTIELSGGHAVFLNPDQHICFTEKGIEILQYVEDKE